MFWVLVILSLFELIVVNGDQKQMLLDSFSETNIKEIVWRDTSKHQCDWIGIDCNGQLLVEKILLMKKGLKGFIHFERLPNSVKQINLRNNQLNGCLDANNLPKHLEGLNIMHNQFDGYLNVSTVSSSLKALDVRNNYLSGGLEIDDVPNHLFHFRGKPQYKKCNSNDTDDSDDEWEQVGQLETYLDREEEAEYAKFKEVDVDGDTYHDDEIEEQYVAMRKHGLHQIQQRSKQNEIWSNVHCVTFNVDLNISNITKCDDNEKV